MLMLISIFLLFIEINTIQIASHNSHKISNNFSTNKSHYETQTIKNLSKNSSCVCLPYYNCLRNGSVNKHGIDVIDPRSTYLQKSPEQCPNAIDICCALLDIKDPDIPNPPLRPHIDRGCGYRNPNGIGFQITHNIYNWAHEDEFPWMVSIFEKEIIENQLRIIYRCGGSLINRRVVLTAARCVSSYTPSRFIIRAGDWDRSTNKELLPHQNRNASIIKRHPKFNKFNIEYDVAIVILEKPFILNENVEIVCLPKQSEITDNQECLVSGWKKNSNNKYQKFSSVLRSFKVAPVPAKMCQQRLRNIQSTGSDIDTLILCTSGISDICRGGSGSPLVCPLKKDPQRYMQFGVVTWNLSCNNQDPATYMNVSMIRPWIDETLKKYNINSTSYTPRGL